ncbi:phosphohistidine phosphatase [Sinosporangium album]|uniref:Phosphohistidine phosphatase n=1 Tax=Sinosporangium album TaxID=504805 RepID=A0A1G7U586_9ACTN|nr:histidine phosphatase family protein [Sinosporangium album]SDG42607.1 phosphohistidine phosphatase [Sinosporangium album]
MAILVVLRHAKAATVPGLPDVDRPLTPRGVRDAERAGQALKVRGVAPDLVVCSPSTRTRQTAEHALAVLSPEARVDFERDIYNAYPDDLVDLLRRTDPEVGTLVLIGHNPGVHELVMGLTGVEDDQAFKPGSFAVLETDVAWAHIGPGDGREVARWGPRD